MEITAIETERLILRPWTLQDAGSGDHIYGDAQTMRLFGTGRAFTPAEVAESLRHIVQDYVEKGYGNRAVVEKSGGEVIGHCGFHESGMPGVRFEADWLIERSRWGRGYATEAARAMLHDFFARGLKNCTVLRVAKTRHRLRSCARSGCSSNGTLSRMEQRRSFG